MSAEVETMFYVGRETPWHGLGISVESAPIAEDAIVLAGLDWEVTKEKVFTERGIQIPNFYATTRNTDGNVYGMVTDKYKVVQNREAFAFMDNLIGEGVKYETAGSLFDGKKVWLLARMPERKILGEKFETYCVLTNSHDGKNAVQVACTPIRVVCNNTLNLAMGSAKRIWSTRHCGTLEGKLADAKDTLGFASTYMDALNVEAEKMATTPLNAVQLGKVVAEAFPINESMSKRQIENAEEARNTFNAYYNRDDVQNFKNTLYGAILAITDYVDHATPQRLTSDYNANRFNKIIGGHSAVDNFVNIAKRVAVA